MLFITSNASLAAPKKDKEDKPIFVDMGRVTIPMMRPQNVTYLVVDLAIEVIGEDNVEKLENSLVASRLKSDILQYFIIQADRGVFDRKNIDSEVVNKKLYKHVSSKYKFIHNLVFVNFVLQDAIKQ